MSRDSEPSESDGYSWSYFLQACFWGLVGLVVATLGAAALIVFVVNVLPGLL